MKKLVLFLLLCPLFLRAQPLRVAVAANAQFVMEELKTAFQKKTSVTVETIVNSSGKLTTQIQQGAPYDVFLSADMDYPQTLHKAGLTTAAPVVYAYGSLVLWTMGELPVSTNLNVLSDPSVRHIAIANPATAPYGEAAIGFLKAKKLLATVQAKIVYGESISQVNQYILSGAAEVGFTAKSVVLDPTLAKRGHWVDVPQRGYAPIAQGVVVLKRTTQPKAAEQFMAFLRSPDAQRILQKFGYQLKP
ncbi:MULTISPECIES: molybdate ABC transporter substrate-binding protein [unclassified Spirosoma]|uniref:molybdate ABC transporter substrate-binding protein n=1 Tax=unclassified Spirosoma TaxID=2621999 RepID=UPI0009672F55|nr:MULTISPECIES: molybdate ABC transporter substrate-binding protein [unclassified Spirosoma]MBN8826097.1 molybdate ABC transporter substrate-binding protein [Spirosoma sp.]OJW74584.1 MAG: molybdate ABC transporter substrate-binding protein [Spirosoma sp. 48-14]